MVFTEQQLQVKKLVDVQQDIEIDALNDGVGALSSTMQNGFTEAANNFSDIQNNLEAMNLVANDRYNEFTGSVNALSNAMTQGFLDMGNTVANISGEIQGQLNQMNVNTDNMNNNIQNQFNGVNIELQNIHNTFELVNTNIGESINAYNEQITNSLSVDMLSANTLICNISATPVSSLTALGYDSNGKVIPVTVIANSNLQLPPSAKYLYTDSVGTPYAGMADTAVSTNENLITSHAVYNAVNDIWTDLNGLHNEVSNSFDVQNLFNEVNNSINNMNVGVQNQFNEVNNSINDMNVGIQNQFIDVWANFDSVNDSISDIDNVLYPVLNYFGAFTPMNYINSTNPVDYQALDTVVFTKGNMGNLWSESSLLGNIYYDWNSTTKTLTFSSSTGIITFNSNMSWTFVNCTNLNQNILISNGVTNMHSTFNGCTNLNQNILIPNGVTDMHSTFNGCTSLNQSILIPSSVTDMYSTFASCTNLNQNVQISNGVIDMSRTFANCTSLNQSILIPSSVTNICSAFSNCTNLNQNIQISNGVTNMSRTFANCTSLNQNILIPSSVTNICYAFSNCTNLNQNVQISNGVTNMHSAFTNCTSLNQNILIPSSVIDINFAFASCTNLNQNIYLYSDKINYIRHTFKDCSLLSDKYIHIRSSIPMSTSNYIYNSLVNNFTDINWSGRVVNDLPEPTTWPPVN